MKISKQIELVQRIDRLIRLKATGSPEDFARKLNMTQRNLYRILEDLKEMGLPIVYNKVRKSYQYNEEVTIVFRFGRKSLPDNSQILGGRKIIENSLLADKLCHL